MLTPRLRFTVNFGCAISEYLSSSERLIVRMGIDGGCDEEFTWLNVEGLPPLARNLGAVKKVLSCFGKILEVGRLDYDSKVLSPVKVLVLTYNMCNIYQNLNIMVNDRPCSVRVFEEQFFASSLISPTTQASNEDESIFKEEGVGPSLVGGGGDEFFGNFDNNRWDNEGSPAVRLPKENPKESGSNNLEKVKFSNDREENVSHTHNVGGLDMNGDPHIVSSNVSSLLGLSQSMDSPHGPSCVKYFFGPIIEEQGQMPAINHTPVIPHDRVVGVSFSALTPVPTMDGNENLDGYSFMRNIGEQIGFSFDGCKTEGGLADFC
ncbi:hypothetical protein Tco_0751783 [Tanacetum coccineum]|uniref:Uncharacterized protein n=1 Tax=Tanacetum coccineum TaxID=301880 RepID=A0ABQ4Z883_9ASTR